MLEIIRDALPAFVLRSKRRAYVRRPLPARHCIQNVPATTSLSMDRSKYFFNAASTEAASSFS
jgi:hypothetical protein